MDTKENMEFDFKELTSLKEFLGYKDLRTITQWCTKNGFKVILIGKKKYITQKSWDEYLFQKQNHGDDIVQCNSDRINSSLADRNNSLAGKVAKGNRISHSFTKDKHAPMEDLFQKYKSKVK